MNKFEEERRMKGKRLVLVALCLIFGSISVFAQEKRFEINGQLGFTFSEGVNINSQEDDELGVNRLSPKSAFSYGLGLDYYINENFAIGFNFAQEKSKLRAGVEDLEGVDISNMNVNNFHVIVTYNFFEEDKPLRPFVFGGLGATNYSPNTIDGNAVEGGTKFSTTWGGGVKYFTTESIGFKGGIRWTPTRIDAYDGGIYCSSYWSWNCWTPSYSNFSHQFELNAGVVVRF
jgi:opacity protein-like surface antigen